eukprot:gb/GECG01004675.1/.p1 GENE.gb/GECG01004675.1/~~gb/GECG01004675.1/.p1  ORF type:complete len:529 (+),score=43.90 gb/GECG01004675.1/:1-1587(+)
MKGQCSVRRTAVSYSQARHAVTTPVIGLPKVSLLYFLLATLSTAVIALESNGTDIRNNEACITPTSTDRLSLVQTCDIPWKARGYGPSDHVKLGVSETFDGQNYTVDLSDVKAFTGLFRINDSVVTSFEQAPVIKNVHTRNGEVQDGGAFIVQRNQRFFKVDHCSSSKGLIGQNCGGIAGAYCGCSDGQVVISNSLSTGNIGDSGGGIIGFRAGDAGGIVNITNCYSTGDITGGGICGAWAGSGSGSQVYVAQCFSTGTVDGETSGGISDSKSASGGGYVWISCCYSTGDITAAQAGGITGAVTAKIGGSVEIHDSYSTGYVRDSVSNAGGICGRFTGFNKGTVLIENVYMLSESSSGTSPMLGSIGAPGFSASKVTVMHSVHSTPTNTTDKTKLIGGNIGGQVVLEGNSGDLGDIRGKLYQVRTSDSIDVNENHRWSDDVWFIPRGSSFPELRAIPQLMCEGGKVHRVNEGIRCLQCPSTQFASRRDSECRPCGFGQVPTSRQDGCKHCADGSVATSSHTSCEPCRK